MSIGEITGMAVTWKWMSVPAVTMILSLRLPVFRTYTPIHIDYSKCNAFLFTLDCFVSYKPSRVVSSWNVTDTCTSRYVTDALHYPRAAASAHLPDVTPSRSVLVTQFHPPILLKAAVKPGLRLIMTERNQTGLSPSSEIDIRVSSATCIL